MSELGKYIDANEIECGSHSQQTMELFECK